MPINFGARPEMRWVAVGDIWVDPSYQRQVAWSHVRKMAREFRWITCQPLTLSLLSRPRGGAHYACIDGQHRLGAAIEADPNVKEMPAYIVTAAEAKQQAALFLAINDSHLRVNNVQRYLAGVAGEDPRMLLLKDVLDRSGVAVWNGGGPKPMQTQSVFMCRRLLERCGSGALTTALRAIGRAWPDHPKAFSEAWIAACTRVAMDLNPTTDELAGVLTPLDPVRTELGARRDGHAEGKTAIAMLQFMVAGKIGKGIANR
jgi:hypothetical protein